MSMFDLTDEVAVVIGATGALGGASAQGMAEAGAKIAVVGRSAERGGKRVESIKAAGGSAQFFACDAMDPDSLKTCHEAVTSELGSPSLPYTGWGTAWFDYDNDGWLDLLTDNGAVDAEGRSGTFPYDQRKTLFRNLLEQQILII